VARARIKVCGITSVEDARLCVEIGVDAIGLNWVSSSPRYIDARTAHEITDAVRGKVMLVGVTANATVDDMLDLRGTFGLDCLQLHGDEPPEALARLLPHAYKAIHVAGVSDVARADAYGGEHLLVDAYAAGALGGTGRAFDWTLVRDLATRRSLTLAGGLHAGNVAEAIRVVRPYCVDVASGVELPSTPRRKDRARLVAFIEAVRAT
jgi:phosphoribosylanthranilate isomerase